MSEGFRKLMEEIESEAKSEGPAAEAELRELRREPPSATSPTAFRSFPKLVAHIVSQAFITATEARPLS